MGRSKRVERKGAEVEKNFFSLLMRSYHMYNKCILLTNHQIPYMQNFHDRPLSLTIPDNATARVERQISIGSPRHITQESSLNCKRRIMTMGEVSFAALWDLFEAPAHTYFCSCHCFCSCDASLLAVHTCCNLHAEYAGGWSLETSMVKGPLLKVGLVMGPMFRKWRPPPFTGWAKSFDGVFSW